MEFIWIIYVYWIIMDFDQTWSWWETIDGENFVLASTRNSKVFSCWIWHCVFGLYVSTVAVVRKSFFFWLAWWKLVLIWFLITIIWDKMLIIGPSLGMESSLLFSKWHISLILVKMTFYVIKSICTIDFFCKVLFLLVGKWEYSTSSFCCLSYVSLIYYQNFVFSEIDFILCVDWGS